MQFTPLPLSGLFGWHGFTLAVATERERARVNTPRDRMDRVHMTEIGKLKRGGGRLVTQLTPDR